MFVDLHSVEDLSVVGGNIGDPGLEDGDFDGFADGEMLKNVYPLLYSAKSGVILPPLLVEASHSLVHKHYILAVPVHILLVVFQTSDLEFQSIAVSQT